MHQTSVLGSVALQKKEMTTCFYFDIEEKKPNETHMLSFPSYSWRTDTMARKETSHATHNAQQFVMAPKTKLCARHIKLMYLAHIETKGNQSALTIYSPISLLLGFLSSV